MPPKSIIGLDFAYTSAIEAKFYSLKLTSGDTVYIRNFAPLHRDTSFYAILSEQKRLIVDSLINNINLGALDTLYESGIIDGYDCTFTISKNDTLKAINIQGGNVPEELTKLMDYLFKIKEEFITPFNEY